MSDTMKKRGGIKFLKIFVSFAYFSLLVYIVFFAPARRQITERYINIKPVRNTINGFLKIDRYNNPDTYILYYNLFGNIALFIPFPFVFISVFRRYHPRSIMLSAFLISLSIEILQYFFRVGVADIDDILLNTSGALIGFILHKILNWSTLTASRQF